MFPPDRDEDGFTGREDFLIVSLFLVQLLVNLGIYGCFHMLFDIEKKLVDPLPPWVMDCTVEPIGITV
jgi:hypothetical protein